MTIKDKCLFWLVGLALLGVFLYAISGMLLPFIVALIVAYFLDPAADALERVGLTRTLATLVITAGFFVVLGGTMLFIAPLIYNQLLAFIDQVPGYIEVANAEVIPYFSHLLERIDPDAIEKAKSSVSDASVHIFQFVGSFAGGVLTSSFAVVNVLSLVFITPIVTFYILRDWDVLVERVIKLLPPKHKDTICEQGNLIDRALSGYIRGQTNVCLMLGTFYAVGLSLVGLDFALLVGIGTGILCFIPYVGVFVGLFVGTLIAYFQFGVGTEMATVVAVFMAGQFVEGNFVSPKLIGDKVGLHPVWIIFGMLAGATMFGFKGILVAIPISAVIAVLARFAIGKYLTSPIYNE